MAALTPPRSQSNTPVRPVVGSTSARIPTSPIASSLADPLASGSAESSSPEKGPADLASDNEKMEGDSPVDSDIGSYREREELEDQGLVMAIVTPSKAEAGSKSSKRSAQDGPSGPTPKGNKGKKKDQDLLESDIVSRWNRDFGDVCAQKYKA